MNPLVLFAAAAAIPIVFAAGVLFHKYVISEANAIKDHVSDEIAEVRLDVLGEVTKLREIVSSALSKAATKI